MSKTQSLATKPSFIRGMGKIFGTGNMEYIKDHFYSDDTKALEDDWRAVGGDMREALDAFKPSIKK